MYSFNSIAYALDFIVNLHGHRNILEARNGRILVCDPDETDEAIFHGAGIIRKCSICGLTFVGESCPGQNEYDAAIGCHVHPMNIKRKV